MFVRVRVGVLEATVEGLKGVLVRVRVELPCDVLGTGHMPGSVPTGTKPTLQRQVLSISNGWRLSCERLLAGRKGPCPVQRRSTAQRTNERFPPAALGSFKR